MIVGALGDDGVVNNGPFSQMWSRFSARYLPLSRQHGAEPVEATFPQGTTLGDPQLGDFQASGLDATRAHAADLGRSNQPAFFERLEVLHHGGESHVQGFGKILGGSRRAAELLHDCASGGIAKRMEHSADRGLVKHRLQYFSQLIHSQV